MAGVSDDEPEFATTMTSSSTAAMLTALSAFTFAAATHAQLPSSAGIAAVPGYADLADLALAASVTAVVTVRDAVRLKDADATGTPPGMARFYLTGDVATLIAGVGGLPARIDWIADVPLVAPNRAPRLRKQRLLLFARPVPGKPGTLQLVSRGGEPAWSPDLEARVRTILAAKVAADAPPAIAGVGHAFHVAGSIPGEGETQIFLKTATGRPVSLSVLRRPGEQPRWSVSLAEIVDDAAAPPARDTLLWYRLACGLPATLPDEAVTDQAPEDAAQAREDYRFVLAALGACGRAASAS